jgi:pyruvate,water dikinase
MIAAEWLHEVEPEPSILWGDLAVALGKVARTGVPVLPGFVLSAAAVQAFYLQPALKQAVEKAMAAHNSSKPQLLAGVTKDIRTAIAKAPIPKEWQSSLKPLFDELEHHLLLKKGSGLRVYCYTNNTDLHPQVGTVKKWEDGVVLFKAALATALNSQTLHDRLELPHGSIMPLPAPVVFQVHPEASASGTGQEYDPHTHDAHTLYLTAHYHESGRKPAHGVDVYRYDRSTLLPLSLTTGKHRWATSHEGSHRQAPPAGVPVLTERQQAYLARLIRKAQTAFEDPQVFSWALVADQLFITAVHPLPTLSQPAPVPEVMPLAFGASLNLGIVTGRARMIRTKKDWDKLETGEIAVISHLALEDREKLIPASGFITAAGHATSLESSLAVSLGVPAVGGVSYAESMIADAHMITVDGTHGLVYEGRILADVKQPKPVSPVPVTGTHVSLIVADPLHVTRSQLLHADGVGLLRGEFLLEMAGVHPQQIIQQGKGEEYGEILKEIVEQAARAAYPNPLRYQLHDIHTTSAASLALRPDRHEPNPKLGYRGAHRLLKEPELVAIELAALSSLTSKGMPVELVLPMVRTAKEARAIEDMIMSLWPEDAEQPRLWVRCETPAMAISAEELCQGRVYGVYFDVLALTQMISGLDEQNYQVAHHLDQADQAVLDALHYAISTCRSKGVQAVLLAEEDELHAAVIEEAVRSGATEVAVSEGEVSEVRALLASIEQRLLIEKSLEEHREVHS